MADEITRSAARTAALIAIPIALLTGLGLIFLARGDAETPSPPAGPAATGPVEMAASELTESQTVVCRQLVLALADQVAGLPQRPVTDGPEQNAAYGDPPVTLTCGAPPAQVPPTDEIYSVVLPPPVDAGVCWHAVEQADMTVWTTLDREVPVRVGVPASYDGPGQLVTELSGPIAQTVPVNETAPSGCA